MSYVINVSKDTTPKKEPTEAEIAKRDFNRKNAVKKFDYLYDTSVEHQAQLDEQSNKLDEQSNINVSQQEQLDEQTNINVSQQEQLDEQTNINVSQQEQLDEQTNINVSQQEQLDVYKNMFKNMIIKMDELHQGLTFNAMSSDFVYIAFDNSSPIDINNFKFNFDIYNFLSVDPDNEDEEITFNKINDEYQTKTFEPKYCNLEFSGSIDNVKTYKREVVNDNEVIYSESDSNDKTIYTIKRNLKIFNAAEREAIKQYFSDQAENISSGNIQNEVYSGRTIDSATIDTIINVLNDDSIFATALYTPVIIEEPHDYSKDYFTIEALEDGNVYFKYLQLATTEDQRYIEYSKDNGETWIRTTNVDNEEVIMTIPLLTGEKALVRGDNDRLGVYNDDEDEWFSSFFYSDIEFNVSGNIMSLIHGENFVGETNVVERMFMNLFYDSWGSYYDSPADCKIVNAKDLILPNTVADYCYYGMFADCTLLTTAPALPAMTLAQNCYYFMFSGCTSLTIAPALPAMTLTQNCYSGMFRGCVLLATAPELPATTLVSNCYNNMFYGCTSLNNIIMLATDISASNCLNNWVNGVASSGTFVKNSDATWVVIGDSGVPGGWTVKTASA